MGREYLNNKMFEKIVVEFQGCKRLKLKNEMIKEAVSGKTNAGEHLLAIVEKIDKEKDALEKSFQESRELLTKYFYVLSQNIINYSKFDHVDAEDAVQEGVLICFEKIDRFHTSKGKAFNYMTTCILNHFRQLYRACKNYIELKKKFKTFLIEKHMRNVVYWNGTQIIMN